MARRTVEGLADAVGQFEKAIKLDPAFALAYVALADTLTLEVDYAGTERDSATDRAGQLVTRALELQPRLREAAVSAALIASTRFELRIGRDRVQARHRTEPELRRGESLVLHYAFRRLGPAARSGDLCAARGTARPAVRNREGKPGRHARQTSGGSTRPSSEYRRAIEIQPSQPNGYLFMAGLEAYALGRVDRAGAVASTDGGAWIQASGDPHRMADDHVPGILATRPRQNAGWHGPYEQRRTTRCRSSCHAGSLCLQVALHSRSSTPRTRSKCCPNSPEMLLGSA
jgi:hypothetical protein